MEPSRGNANVIAFPRRRRIGSADIRDLRFRGLVDDAAWAKLPAAVRTRFEHHIGAGATALYAGEVVECRMSRCGRLLAQLARAIGSPLPLCRDAFVPAAVSVTEDPQGGGQVWTRIYGRRRGFPQVIHSAKRFAGPTGLEEHIGCGFGIALRVVIEGEALHFDSDHYFLRVAGTRLRLPRWLSPGAMRVSHVDCGGGSFAFVLRVVHPWLGELVCQTAMFEDRPQRGEAR